MKIFSPILKGTTTVAQGTTNLSGSFTGSLFGTAATASYADNFTVGGTLTAQTINVQIITSSIEFNTGSTRNGALSSNTHQFTGSVLMSGSLNVSGAINLGPSAVFPTVGLFNRTSDTTLYIVTAPTGFTLLDNSQNTMYGATPTSHIWNISNSEKMRINSSGSVGIGTTNPTGISSDVKLAVTNGSFIVDTENNGYGGLKIDTDSTGDYNVNIRQGRGGATGGIRFFTAGRPGGGGAFTGTGNERLTILGTGNVGIGNTSPEYRVDLCPFNAELPQDVIRLGVYNGPSGGGGNTLGTGIIWKPYYSGYTRRSAGIVQIAENNYFRAALAFYTNNNADQTTDWSERMRITSGGVVQISNAGDAQLQLNASGATGYVRYTNSSGDIWGTGIGFNIATNFELYNFTTATYGFRVTRSGIYATTATSPRSVFVQSDGTLGGISSVRESKTNITSLDSSWLMQLNPVSFNYRKKDTEDKYTNEHYDELFYGLIAEEVESVNKEICTYNEDKLIGIEYTKIIPVLVKAIQELKSENDTLKEILQRNNIQ